MRLTDGETNALTLVIASMLKDVSVQMIQMPNFNLDVNKDEFTVFGISSKDKKLDITINPDEKDIEKCRANFASSLAQLYNYAHKGSDIKPEKIKNDNMAQSTMLLNLIYTSKDVALVNPLESGDRISRAKANRQHFRSMMMNCDPTSNENGILFFAQTYIHEIYENLRPVTGVMVNNAIEQNRVAYVEYLTMMNDILSDISKSIDNDDFRVLPHPDNDTDWDDVNYPDDEDDEMDY